MDMDYSGLYGDMNLSGNDLFPVGVETESQDAPAQETAVQPVPPAAQAFNAVANALVDPIGTVADVLSPDKVSASKIPFEWAMVGACIVFAIWAGSWLEKKS